MTFPKALASCLALSALLLSACVNTAPVASYGPVDGPLAAPDPVLNPQVTARNFRQVVQRMEPLVEAECRARQPRRNCDFQIVVDTSPGAPPNAYQTLDPSGRPILAFTLGLIADARNADELAFVMGHESAHHILNHIGREQQTAVISGALTGVLAAALGGDPTAIRAAQDMGAQVGARSYSKEFELEADEMGAILSWNAGYDPERGAAFFTRLPDPGDSFLGTHPASSQRIALVRQTVARLRAGI
jgi:predicted Zn-dependent protease